MVDFQSDPLGSLHRELRRRAAGSGAALDLVGAAETLEGEERARAWARAAAALWSRAEEADLGAFFLVARTVLAVAEEHTIPRLYRARYAHRTDADAEHAFEVEFHQTVARTFQHFGVEGVTRLYLEDRDEFDRRLEAGHRQAFGGPGHSSTSSGHRG